MRPGRPPAASPQVKAAPAARRSMLPKLTAGRPAWQRRGAKPCGAAPAGRGDVGRPQPAGDREAVQAAGVSRRSVEGAVSVVPVSSAGSPAVTSSASNSAASGLTAPSRTKSSPRTFTSVTRPGKIGAQPEQDEPIGQDRRRGQLAVSLQGTGVGTWCVRGVGQVWWGAKSMTQWSFSGSWSISLSKVSGPSVGWLTCFIAELQVPISPFRQ